MESRLPYTVYRGHYCETNHRTYKAFAKCIWKGALWITGQGPYALVAPCGAGTSVSLHKDATHAETVKGHLDKTYCGGYCVPDRHRIVRLELHSGTPN